MWRGSAAGRPGLDLRRAVAGGGGKKKAESEIGGGRAGGRGSVGRGELRGA